ncbi:MAG: ORF6N domain-containing protein [Lentimicrobiaceae bacterium]|nr:ORF6N domain-containing protein [Lentimicrobiaceae bacterium]
METSIIVQDRRKDIAEFSIIRNKIYEIRGQKVMLDFDLAAMYEVETRRLNEQVKRNSKRFPFDFMFQLTNQEYTHLISQFATSSWGGTRKLPYAFTEHGVTMLASVLKSERAIDANIQIVRAFIALRQYALGYAELKQELENFKTETKTQIGGICEVLDELIQQKKELEKPRTPIGFVQKNTKNKTP